VSDQDDAKQMVDEFAARTSGSLWIHINRADVAAGLKERIDDPDKIDQADCNLCGPADYCWDLASDKPKLYAQLGIDLYEKASALIGSLKVKPTKDLLNHYLPSTSTINAADWVTMASIRDSDNWIIDFQSESDAAAGITMPHSLTSWFKDTGYTKVVNDTNVYFSKNLACAKEASRLRGDGYRVCLFINANMIDVKTQDDSSTTPDHWVMLTSAMTITGTTSIKFRIYTWGSERDVPSSGTLTVAHFLDNFYGYVAAKF
jgi:hypothetical protein